MEGAVKRKRWFAVTTWNAHRMDKWLKVNRINGHLIGLVIRLPDGESSSGKTSHHSLSIGRYRGRA
jgi:hypothetical protein